MFGKLDAIIVVVSLIIYAYLNTFSPRTNELRLISLMLNLSSVLSASDIQFLKNLQQELKFDYIITHDNMKKLIDNVDTRFHGVELYTASTEDDIFQKVQESDIILYVRDITSLRKVDQLEMLNYIKDNRKKTSNEFDSCFVSFSSAHWIELAQSDSNLLIDIPCILHKVKPIQSWNILNHISIRGENFIPDEKSVTFEEKRIFDLKLSPYQMNQYWRMKDPSVGIIIPFYNIEKLDWLCDLFKSIFIQTFQDFEVILVDDSSTNPLSLHLLDAIKKEISWPNNTWAGKYKFEYEGQSYECDANNPGIEIFKKYGVDSGKISLEMQQIPFKIVTTKQNCGLGCARNTGVLTTRARFVTFIDPDDLIEYQALEGFFYASSLKFGSIDSRQRGDQNRRTVFAYPTVISANYDDEFVLKSAHKYLSLSFTTKNIITNNPFVSSCFYSKQFYLAIGGNCAREYIKHFEDWDFWQRLHTLGGEGVGVLESRFWYRRHNKGQSTLLSKSGDSGETAPWILELQMNNPGIYKLVEQEDMFQIMSQRSNIYSKYFRNRKYNLKSQNKILAKDEDYLPCYKPIPEKIHHSPARYFRAKNWLNFFVPYLNGPNNQNSSVIVLFTLAMSQIDNSRYLDVLKNIRSSNQGYHIALLIEQPIQFVKPELRDLVNHEVDIVIDLDLISGDEDDLKTFILCQILARNVQKLYTSWEGLGHAMQLYLQQIFKNQEPVHKTHYLRRPILNSIESLEIIKI